MKGFTVLLLNLYTLYSYNIHTFYVTFNFSLMPVPCIHCPSNSPVFLLLALHLLFCFPRYHISEENHRIFVRVWVISLNTVTSLLSVSCKHDDSILYKVG